MRPDKQAAYDAGIPSAFRRYSARYGAGVGDMIQTHKKHLVGMLDHAGDKGRALREALLTAHATFRADMDAITGGTGT